MAAANSNFAPMFAGKFCHALDAKKRLTVPAKWRSKEGDDLFYLVPHHKNPCLVAMPAEEYRRMYERAEGMQGAERGAFLTMLGADTVDCTLDKSGRLLLTEEHCKRAGIGTDVVLVGAVSKFQVWSAQGWEEYLKANANAFAVGGDFVGL